MSSIVCWWSGGVTSAVACKVAIDLFGLQNCRIIFQDTFNEHDDTYRFKSDCEKWYGKEIETITAIGDTYSSIEETWFKHLSLNTATGAICSYMLKRRVREKWQKENDYKYQVFGFEFNSKEFKRALGISSNHPKAKPIFPLLMVGYDKEKCIEVINEANIKLPDAYLLGFQNNNCLKTGCVQGGIGYWQKMKKENIEVFNKMAKVEHELTNLKGEQVTMLKDQSNEAKKKAKKDKTLQRVFLKKHPDYPDNKCIDDMGGRPVEPLVDCNGFCGSNDLIKNNTQMELNYE